jgi:hypothetical protein
VNTPSLLKVLLERNANCLRVPLAPLGVIDTRLLHRTGYERHRKTASLFLKIFWGDLGRSRWRAAAGSVEPSFSAPCQLLSTTIKACTDKRLRAAKKLCEKKHEPIDGSTNVD